MKRLTVALLLLAVAIPCNASEWINSHALYMYFANAEDMVAQQQDFNMYEINSSIWGEHPSASTIMIGKTIGYLGYEKVKTWLPGHSGIIEAGFFVANLYWALHDMSHEFDNQPGRFCGGSVTFNTLIHKEPTCTIHWEELEVQREKDIARILDPMRDMYASTGK